MKTVERAERDSDSFLVHAVGVHWFTRRYHATTYHCSSTLGVIINLTYMYH